MYATYTALVKGIKKDSVGPNVLSSSVGLSENKPPEPKFGVSSGCCVTGEGDGRWQLGRLSRETSCENATCPLAITYRACVLGRDNTKCRDEEPWEGILMQGVAR